MAPQRFAKVQRRVLILDEILRADRPNSLKELADRLGVTIRTVCRDLAHMKEVLHLPVQYQRGHGYRYAHWVPPLADPSAFAGKRWDSPRPLGSDSLRRLLETLHGALVERRAVDFQRSGEREWEPFHPHFLSRFRGEWTLFGWNPAGRHPASHPLALLQAVRLREKTFVLPQAEPAVRTRGGWVAPGRSYGVGIRFSSHMPWALDLRICEDQEKETQVGWTAYRFRTDSLEAVRNFLALCPREGVAVEEPSLFRSLLREHLLGYTPPRDHFPRCQGPGIGKGP
ncbi:MAG: helix-turn-helix transcriptional regulator [Acidobacteriota bacterium]